jgi:hypothetical protein
MQFTARCLTYLRTYERLYYEQLLPQGVMLAVLQRLRQDKEAARAAQQTAR